MTPAPRAVPLLSAGLLLAAPLAAQWQPVPTPAAPAARTEAALARGPDGAPFLCGGRTAGTARGDLWRFAGADWEPLGTAPIALAGAAMAFDEARGELVVFGGETVPGTPTDATFVFDGSAWSPRAPAVRPPARSGAGMVHDRRRGVLVLFGGSGAAGPLGDTWEWDGTDWMAASAAVAPPAQARPALVYDDTRQEVALLAVPMGDFWLFDGSDWTQQVALPVPGSALVLASDPLRGRLVAAASDGTTARTFEYDGLDWQPVGPVGQPLPFAAGDAAAAFDPARGAVVFVHTASLVTVQAWTPVPGALVLPFGAPCVDPARTLRAAPGSLPEPGRTLVLELPALDATWLPVGLLGLSRTAAGAATLPLPVPGPGPNPCLLRVEPLAGVPLPNLAGTALWALPIPPGAALLGAQVQLQAFALSATGLEEASNGLELQVGLAAAPRTSVESFDHELGRDPLASGDRWTGGRVVAVALGGDGRHGSFRPDIGFLVAPGVFELSTDHQVIPAGLTLSGESEIVHDGRFHFTDFAVPAGVTVRFAGTNPAQVFVRGRTLVLGTIDASAEDLTAFQARISLAGQPIAGQPGGRPGPGGGRGGRGGDRCLGQGPTLVGGVVLEDGQDGEDVQVAGTHAYLAQSAGTGGRGSPLHPAHGRSAQLNYMLGFVFNGDLNAGGSGGGHQGAGAMGRVQPPIPTGLVPGLPTAGGAAFPLLPLPPPVPGHSSLVHFLAGGSGGGGGGSHPYASIISQGNWVAGCGGTGGGGALAIRSGADLLLGPSASLLARGGAGPQIDADDPATPMQESAISSGSWGIAAPGGGGSGGSILLQSARDLVVQALLDTSGGTGGFTANILPVQVNHRTDGGRGADGFYRLEAGGTVQVTNPAANVPAFDPARHTGTLTDRDVQGGSRSTWRHTTGTGALPVYVRYELLVDVAGQTLLFSDDPATGAGPADGSNPLVRVRFQAARALPDGRPDPQSIGPWRDSVRPAGPGYALGHDRGDLFRFDLTTDTTVAVPSVRELRVIWR